MRERLSSRIGFILLSAGCAIGIGNVWRFPFVCGQNGGACFVLIYLFFLAVLGLPIMVMEFAAGRAAQRSIARLHRELVPNRPWWNWHGVGGSLGNLMLMMFYTTVASWMVLYFLKYLDGSFATADTLTINDSFGVVLGNWHSQTWTMLGVSIGSAAVCAIGLQKGIERVSKWMMAALLVLIVVLAIHSTLLPGSGRGLEFYLVPSLSRMRAAGFGNVSVEAMNQAFFTLSLGIGAMAIFGSYIGRSRALLGEALHIIALDTFVAICAGLVIFPACFAYGISPGQGPGLIFATLPNVFAQMSGGRWWGALFFLFMTFAALTTVLAVFETILASLTDYTGMTRRQGALVLAIVVPLFSMPCILGFNLWSGFQPFGAGSTILDLEDFVVSDILLPLGSIGFAIFCTSRYGWGWRNFVDEASAGEGFGLNIQPGGIKDRLLHAYCGYVLPLIVLGVFLMGLYRRFCS